MGIWKLLGPLWTFVDNCRLWRLLAFRDDWRHLGMFRDIVVHLGTYKDVRGCLGTFRDVLEHIETFRDDWGHFGTLREFYSLNISNCSESGAQTFQSFRQIFEDFPLKRSIVPYYVLWKPRNFPA